MKKIVLGVEKAVNPSTGEVDLIGALLHVTKKVNAEVGVKKDGLYNTFTGSLQARLLKHGILSTYVADFILLMQEICLARKISGGLKTVWELADETFFDSIVNERIIQTGLNNIRLRHTKSRELWLLQNRVIPKLEKQAKRANAEAPAQQDLSETLDKIGELIVEIERLKKELEEKELSIKKRNEYIAQQKEKIKALEKAGNSTKIDDILAKAIVRARSKI